MIRLSVAALGCVLAGSAAAELIGFGNDYKMLFERHAAEVQQPEPGRVVLELPGPVIVERIGKADGAPGYRGRDESGLGAAACILDGLIEASVLDRHCPGLLTPQERRILDAMTRAMARYTGANVVPQVDVRDVAPRLQALLQSRAAALDVVCPGAETADQDLAARLKAVVGPGGIKAVKLTMTKPRLAVMEPCK